MIYSDLRPFILFHDGPFTTAKDMDICLDRAAVHGVFSGSAAERIPVERTVMHTVAEEGADSPSAAFSAQERCRTVHMEGRYDGQKDCDRQLVDEQEYHAVGRVCKSTASRPIRTGCRERHG